MQERVLPPSSFLHQPNTSQPHICSRPRHSHALAPCLPYRTLPTALHWPIVGHVSEAPCAQAIDRLVEVLPHHRVISVSLARRYPTKASELADSHHPVSRFPNNARHLSHGIRRRRPAGHLSKAHRRYAGFGAVQSLPQTIL
jgi:hypothetical protein